MISQKCKIVIYKQCKILPNRNFAVDNLLNYLENEDFFAFF